MESRACLVLASVFGCLACLAMGSRANTIAHATSVKPQVRTKAELRAELVKSIASGVQIALDQCREEFKWDRWNCPEHDFSRRNSLAATREMAYVGSITAAGVCYAVARSCARGQMLPECRCLNTDGAKEADWSWQNCASDLKAGQRVARLFLQALDQGARDIRSQANVHNFQLGTKVVELESGEECKCYGVSGSCTSRTCWGRVAPFPKVGRTLKDRYQRALRVAANSLHKVITPEHQGEMLFLEDSPDYCKPNNTTGWPGTAGRVCSRRRDRQADRAERRSCRELCRSCGHQVRARPLTTVWRCNCTFHWCCNVTCSVCTKTEKEHYCDGAPSPLHRRAAPQLHQLTL